MKSKIQTLFRMTDAETTYSVRAFAAMFAAVLALTAPIVLDVFEPNVEVAIVEIHEPTVTDGGRVLYPTVVEKSTGIETMAIPADAIDEARSRGASTLMLDADEVHVAYDSQFGAAAWRFVAGFLLGVCFASSAGLVGSSYARKTAARRRRAARAARVMDSFLLD